ncbi:MAG: vWA domain-containing protein [Rectinemataceae bacterium]
MKTRQHPIPGGIHLALAAIFLLPAAVSALDLRLAPTDLRVERNPAGGFDLYVRAKPDINSVLLVETTKDPNGKADNFAYRAEKWNPVNGDELRLLNGKLLPPQNRLYSLISSKALKDEAFGLAFHIYLPSVIVYGYTWSRSGSVAVGNGTFVNIRAFQKPYADYSAAFLDNPYNIVVKELRTPLPKPELPPGEIPAGKAPSLLPSPLEVVEIPPPPPVVEAPPPPQPTPPPAPPPPEGPPSAQIGAAIDAITGERLDLVVCIDTTDSMTPYLEDLKKNLIKLLKDRIAKFKNFRIGLVLFKDYWPDDYITLKVPFTSDLKEVNGYIMGLKAKGGADVPEAIREAFFVAASDFEWQADRRLAVLLTDAPIHPRPKGGITWFDAAKALSDKGIEVEVLVIPEAEVVK